MPTLWLTLSSPHTIFIASTLKQRFLMRCIGIFQNKSIKLHSFERGNLILGPTFLSKQFNLMRKNCFQSRRNIGNSLTLINKMISKETAEMFPIINHRLESNVPNKAAVIYENNIIKVYA